MDFVLVITPIFNSIRSDRDQPSTYFSSGVDPESNTFEWGNKQSNPKRIEFARQGTFSIGEEEWRTQLPDDALSLPRTLTDRQFVLSGEKIRFSLEHLPRAKPQNNSSANGNMRGGSVLVKVAFRGKTQVLMEAEQPDGGSFTLSVGMVDGKPSVRVDHQPHYNNSFRQYWTYDEFESRFRHLRIEHAQGC